ncbi:hypothetical protein ACFY30_18425 [Streptomyces sp. NPDC000345]|uniref:hypothetical protein n=1 Tax=Streptomyces sp. NPDC000345 TaxID=3364537 RepID=UPI0036B33A35
MDNGQITNPVHNFGSPAKPGGRSGLGTGVVSIGSGSVHVTSHPFHLACPPPEWLILLAMTSPLGTRVYVMTVALLVCVVGSGACFGFVVDGWVGAVAGASTTSVGAGFGMLARPGPQ